MASLLPLGMNGLGPPPLRAGDSFRVAMAAVGLTEEDLSLALSLDLSTVRGWCDGTLPPPQEVAEALRHLVEVQNRVRPP